jgi:ribosomal-protein-alanine N-acetyltransferase
MPTYWLKTERLGFSRWTENALNLARWLWGDPAVSRYISTGPFTERQIAERLATEVRYGREQAMQYWPIFRQHDGAFVGCCGLKPHQPGSAELGAHLLPEFWHQGYASEASLAVIAYAFRELGLTQLVAGHHPQNKASERTLTRLGFVRVGEEYYPPTGLMHPSYVLRRQG